MLKKRNARPRPLPRVRPEDIKIISGVRPRFLRLNEACEYGGFCRQRAYDLINAGKLKAIKLGRRTLVEVASIDRLHNNLPKVSEKEARAS